MPLRNDWTIQVDAEKLADICRERVDWHRQRLTYWQNETMAADETLRSKGIDIKEFQVTGGARLEASLDERLARRFAECQAKTRKHTADVLTYLRWKDFLGAMNGATMSLDEHDFAFFQSTPLETTED